MLINLAAHFLNYGNARTSTPLYMHAFHTFFCSTVHVTGKTIFITTHTLCIHTGILFTLLYYEDEVANVIIVIYDSATKHIKLGTVLRIGWL